ncbi:MAG: SAM-dependent methyltransferase [Limisphaerales bacterium]
MKRLLLCSTFALATLLAMPACAQERGNARQAEAPSRSPDVIFVPTPQEAVDKMLEMAELKPGQKLYDLGCGDGRIVVTAAKKYGVRAVGIDIDPQRVKESRENVKKNNVGNLAEIRHADIFEVDFSDADVVTMYLLPSLNVKLIPQLQKLKPGARIISYSFDMQGVEPTQVVNDPYTIYKWVAPIRPEITDAAGAERKRSRDRGNR